MVVVEVAEIVVVVLVLVVVGAVVVGVVGVGLGLVPLSPPPGDTGPSGLPGALVSKSYSVSSTISQVISMWPAEHALDDSSLRTE